MLLSKDLNFVQTKLHTSQFATIVEECLILGDEGYSITPWTMTPYRNPGTAAQRNYNNIFCQERTIIERCFGQLKARFPILQYKVRTKFEKIPPTIVSCVVLHNTAKWLGDDDFNMLDIPHDFDNNHQAVNNEDNRGANVLRQLGVQRRELIAEQLLNNAE
ncbi:hypothetical protein NQ315_007477 [Exocentrus adspersus]|uniref:DDE Tnp4 domain-containing protein n=1 Tax=Exocentrus adspersus TaxID=1586481 RepID=A0AAV8V856_9CUCU|nr:hypothetical protein NQ315_007477 [Exocentrus adspersus]